MERLESFVLLFCSSRNRLRKKRSVFLQSSAERAFSGNIKDNPTRSSFDGIVRLCRCEMMFRAVVGDNEIDLDSIMIYNTQY